MPRSSIFFFFLLFGAPFSLFLNIESESSLPDFETKAVLAIVTRVTVDLGAKRKTLTVVVAAAVGVDAATAAGGQRDYLD